MDNVYCRAHIDAIHKTDTFFLYRVKLRKNLFCRSNRFCWKINILAHIKKNYDDDDNVYIFNLIHSLAKHNHTYFRLVVVAHSPGHYQTYIMSRALQKKPYKSWLECNRDILPKDNNIVIICHGCSHRHHCCYWHNYHHIAESLCNSITMYSVSATKNSIIIYLLCSCCKGFFRSSASLSRFVIGTYIYLCIEFIMCVPTSV